MSRSLSWREIKAKWEADPAFREAYDEEYPYAAVALAIAKLRAENDLTQEQFAQRVGTTQSVIARLESGRHAISSAMLRRIAKAFGLEWEPTFRPAGSSAEADPPAVNDVAVLGSGMAITADYIIDTKTTGRTFSFRWPATYPVRSPEFIYFDLDAVIDRYLEELDEAPSVPLAAAVWGPGSSVFSNQPFAASKGRQSALVRH